MNTKQHETYNRIFSNPVRSDIPWTDIESMFLALGAEISEGNGSRIRIQLNGVRSVFHRLHPQKAADKGAVKSVRRFWKWQVLHYDEL
ncbi:MAG: type II toxin-antitoxin system HicA family toxin [Lachnospiraceae bacterium]|nr:type II toxin-antitoxin system HicA family toxin [Lachnospiraceae bacterium]